MYYNGTGKLHIPRFWHICLHIDGYYVHDWRRWFQVISSSIQA